MDMGPCVVTPPWRHPEMELPLPAVSLDMAMPLRLQGRRQELGQRQPASRTELQGRRGSAVLRCDTAR